MVRMQKMAYMYKRIVIIFKLYMVSTTTDVMDCVDSKIPQFTFFKRSLTKPQLWMDKFKHLIELSLCHIKIMFNLIYIYICMYVWSLGKKWLYSKEIIYWTVFYALCRINFLSKMKFNILCYITKINSWLSISYIYSFVM